MRRVVFHSMTFTNSNKSTNYHTMKYHIIDQKNIGRGALPHMIAPCDKVVQETLGRMAGNRDKYFEHKDKLMDLIPEALPCKLVNRKTPVDYMGLSKPIVSLQAIVSQKIKNIFDNLGIRPEECSFRKISLKGFENDSFYFLIIPRIPNTDIVLSKCDFCSTETYDLQNTVKFSSWEDATKAYLNLKFKIHSIVLIKDYNNYDVLQPQWSIMPFFSERILEAFDREKVVGYEIYQGNRMEGNFNFRQELLFDNE